MPPNAEGVGHDEGQPGPAPGPLPASAAAPAPGRRPGDPAGMEALLDHLPVFAYRTRPAGAGWSLDYISGGVEAITGYPVSEFLERRGQASVTLILAEDQAWVWPALQRQLEARQPFAFEYRIRTASGEVRWLLDKGRGIYAAHGALAWIDGFATDITARKQTEEALRASREEWRALFEATADPVFLADADTGVILDANPAAERLMGLPRERLVGLHQKRLHPADLHAAIGQAFAEFAAGRQAWTESEVLTSDGRRVPVQIIGSAVTVRGDRRVIQGRFHDLTEEQRASAALRQSEERYRHLFEMESDAILLLRLEDLHVLDANRAAESLFGYRREELLALRIHDLAPDPDRAASAFRERRRHVATAQARRQDGTVFPIEVTFSYFDENGQPVCLAAIRDITARVKAMEEQQEAARRIALLLDSLPGFAFRGRFLPEWRVDYVSEGILGVTGYPAADFINGVRTVESLMLPEEYATVEAEMHRELVARAGYAVRFRIRHASGEVRWVLTKCQATAQGGGLVAAEGFTADITTMRRIEEEREQLQQQLLQAHKMESIGRLAGGVAHDFNNLLTVILGACEAIEDNARDLAILTEVRQIRQAGGRARSLTRQLLAYGRRQMLSLKPTDLSRVVADHLDLLRRLIGEDVRIDTALAPDLWAVRGDEAQLTQVLVNLAANARDAMPAGGTLSLQTGNRVVRPGDEGPVPGLVPGEYVVLTVTDTGCGMSAEVREHAFEPFYTTKDVSKGAGLGLATVHGIISQHSGRICVESAPGKGACFRIALPRLRSGPAGEEPQTRGAAVPIAAGAGRTVLLVEDDVDVRRMVQAFMARRGYRVEAAASPEEAIAIASQMDSLDLLVSDVVLPGINGRELHAQLEAHRPGLRVLYISGYPGTVLTDRGSLDESRQFLQKPFSATELAARIGGILGAPLSASEPG